MSKKRKQTWYDQLVAGGHVDPKPAKEVGDLTKARNELKKKIVAKLIEWGGKAEWKVREGYYFLDIPETPDGLRSYKGALKITSSMPEFDIMSLYKTVVFDYRTEQITLANRSCGWFHYTHVRALILK